MASSTKLGIGRLLIAVYAIFAISASARALFQLLTKFEEAPLAYSLSLVAASVYILATVGLAKSRSSSPKLAWFTVGFELLGVVVVGSLSIFLPKLFEHPSVWSNFGQGYGFIPLVLPILGLVWLGRSRNS